MVGLALDRLETAAAAVGLPDIVFDAGGFAVDGFDVPGTDCSDVTEPCATDRLSVLWTTTGLAGGTPARGFRDTFCAPLNLPNDASLRFSRSDAVDDVDSHIDNTSSSMSPPAALKRSQRATI